MEHLLTETEYKAIAKNLILPDTAFIDGRFQAGNGAVMPTINPATGETLSRIQSCDAHDVDKAVGKAREVFEKGCWSHAHPIQRKDILIKLCKLLTRNRNELAVMESIDSGKPIRDCVLVDIPETIHAIKWHAEAIDKIYGQTAPTGNDALAFITREAIGVVGLVLPWNFPLLMLAWKIGPALAAGNSVIIKPAEQTSLTALRVAELAIEAGIPRGVMQVLPGHGECVGKALGCHPDVDMISFTGSTHTGKCFLQYAAQSNLKKIVLECGGKNSAIVLEDVENIDWVAQHIVNGAFWNMGENCSAISRLIVHKNIKEHLIRCLIARLDNWKTGDPLNPAHHLGALIDEAHYTKIVSYLEKTKKAQSDKETFIIGGVAKKPYVYPTIIDVADPDSALIREEIFGPVLSLITVSTGDEAIAVANDSHYGLTASVFTSNIKKAMRMARALKAGTVTVNCYGEGDMTTPFGGYKQSGFGGRDKSLHAHDQYTELKTVWVDLNDAADEDAVE